MYKCCPCSWAYLHTPSIYNIERMNTLDILTCKINTQEMLASILFLIYIAHLLKVFVVRRLSRLDAPKLALFGYQLVAVINTYQLSVFGNYENSSNLRSVHHPYTYFSSMSQSCDLRIEFGQLPSFESYQLVYFYLRPLYINSPRVFKSCEPLRKIQSKSIPSIASVYLVPFVGHKEHHFANSYLSTDGAAWGCVIGFIL